MNSEVQRITIAVKLVSTVSVALELHRRSDRPSCQHIPGFVLIFAGQATRRVAGAGSRENEAVMVITGEKGERRVEGKIERVGMDGILCAANVALDIV